MTLYQKIISIYPELESYDFAFGTIQLKDDSDGKGPYIARWEHTTFARPTDAQLAEIN